MKGSSRFERVGKGNFLWNYFKFARCHWIPSTRGSRCDSLIYLMIEADEREVSSFPWNQRDCSYVNTFRWFPLGTQWLSLGVWERVLLSLSAFTGPLDCFSFGSVGCWDGRWNSVRWVWVRLDSLIIRRMNIDSAGKKRNVTWRSFDFCFYCRSGMGGILEKLKYITVLGVEASIRHTREF